MTLISENRGRNGLQTIQVWRVKSLKLPNMYKEWVSSLDDRVHDGSKGGPDHESMNGQSVPLDDSFTIPPDYTMDGLVMKPEVQKIFAIADAFWSF